MKKLIFINNNMQIGGVQKSLVNLLWELSPRYEMTLFLFDPEGPLMAEVPPGVRVAGAGPLLRALGMSHAQARGKGLLPLLWRGFLVVLTRLFTIRFVFPLLSRRERIDGEYDAAISYLHNGALRCFYGGCAEAALNSVRAPKKVCFVHCDFERYEGNNAYNAMTLSRFDRVAAVSRSVGEGLLRAVPGLEGKVFPVHNCYHARRIADLARAYEAPHTPGVLNLFTAARLSREKGVLRMIPILGRIRDMGIGFFWRIAGNGPDREAVLGLIRAQGLEGQIALLGELDNPYPYFTGADVLLVPSYVEAAPMVFGEARLLGVPVFTTDTSSARELIGESNTGRVLPNEDGALLKELARLLRDFDQLRFDLAPPDDRLAAAEFDRLLEG